jgi:hypothetical protein
MAGGPLSHCAIKREVGASGTNTKVDRPAATPPTTLTLDRSRGRRSSDGKAHRAAATSTYRPAVPGQCRYRPEGYRGRIRQLMESTGALPTSSAPATSIPATSSTPASSTGQPLIHPLPSHTQAGAPIIYRAAPSSSTTPSVAGEGITTNPKSTCVHIIRTSLASRSARKRSYRA